MLVGPVHALALLLLVAALAKQLDPGPATLALRQAALPSRTIVVRLLGGAEAAAAGGVLLVGGPIPAAGLGLAYLGFAAFLLRLRGSGGPAASCGCFGGADVAGVGRLHLTVNVVAASLVGLSLAGSLPSVPVALEGPPMVALAYAVSIALGAWVTGLCLTSLPSLLAAQRRVTT